MRYEHTRPGLRVVVTGGQHKGQLGTVCSERTDPYPTGGGTRLYASRVSVELDNGTVIEMMPRWLEPEDDGYDFAVIAHMYPVT